VSRIPEDVAEWLSRVASSPTITLNSEEKRTLEDMLNHVVFAAAVQQVMKVFDERKSALISLDPISHAAEILRIQGELRGVVAVFGALWETANADVS
jgi:hypothetical protein